MEICVKSEKESETEKKLVEFGVKFIFLVMDGRDLVWYTFQKILINFRFGNATNLNALLQYRLGVFEF